ncbi:MAG TPA: alpha/beta hydrolase [Candidatus Acidoferrum sp.]|nr:alpha/beta hydrolase [Candidatus Acidoferrum sp.]
MIAKTTKSLFAFLALAWLTIGHAAETKTVTIKVEKPAHGSVSLAPPLPDNGQVAAGTVIHVKATAEAGYALDTVWQTLPGMFPTYAESRDADYRVVADVDKTVGALFLPVTELSGWKEVRDVVYAKPGVKPLKYDVYSPPNAKGLPLVVIIHGGGWTANNEDIMRGMAREIVRSGRYVAVSMDYRWAGKGDGDSVGNTMVDLIDDVFGGLAHIQQHAAEYGADPQRIAVTGDSAGGHLSAVAATMVDMVGSKGFGKQPGVFQFMPSYLPPGKTAEQVGAGLKAAIKVAAPSYGVFAEPAKGPGLSTFTEPGVGDASWLAAIAPIHHVPAVAERAIPHYLIRGTVDPLISKAMVDDYEAALKAKGQQVKHVEVEGASHAFYDWKPDQQTRDTFAKFGVPHIHDMLAFFDDAFKQAR